MISEEEKQAIIKFYLEPNNLRPTADKFKHGIPTIKKILIEHNVPFHSVQTIKNGTIKRLKQSCLEKYGVEFSFQSENNKLKSKQTLLKKYGVDNYAKTAECKQKYKNTCLKKYGVSNYTKTKKYLIKQKITCRQKYNADSYTQSKEYKTRHDEIIQKTIATNNRLFNTDWFSQTAAGKEKILNNTKKALYTLYGVEYYSKTQKWKNKVLNTNNIKYNADWYTQTTDYHKKSRKMYNIIEEHFDSLPELAFYLYHKELNIPIERSHICFKYYFNNKKHLYFPDFIVNDTIIEIKGDHFVKSDGTWQNPFNKSLDGLFEAKHQCALKNNVKIIYSTEYKQYIDWFYSKGYKKEDFLINERN